jgi:hypothetical protein
MTDLFGEEVGKEYTGRHPHTLIEKKLGPLHYRKSEDKEKRCKTCVNLFSCRGYYKCKLLGTSMSPATDIRVGHICDAWKKEDEK